MIDWTELQANDKISQRELAIIYLYTPLCGTCQVAKKMLTVVEAAVPGLDIGMINVNYARELALSYEVESVPCLLVFQQGKILKRIYAFQSVEYLYHELKPLVL